MFNLAAFFVPDKRASAGRRQAEQAEQAEPSRATAGAQRADLADRIGKYILMIDCILLICLLNITPFLGQSGDIFGYARARFGYDGAMFGLGLG